MDSLALMLPNPYARWHGPPTFHRFVRRAYFGVR